MKRALAAVALIVVTGCHGRDSEEIDTEAAVPVAVEKAHVGTLTAYVHASGVVEARPDADLTITAPSAARVLEVKAAAGDSVKRGQPLVRFEVPQLQADHAARAGERRQAEAHALAARRNHERLAGLFEKGIAARREVDEAQRDFAEAEAAVEAARQAEASAASVLERAQVVAPFDGIVAMRWHSAGDLIDANEHVLRVVDPQRLEVACGVAVTDAPRVHPGQSVRVRVPGGGEEGTLEGRVSGAPAIVDSTTGAVSVRVKLSGTLPVGTPVDVDIATEKKDGALIVPAAAIVREEEKTLLLVVDAKNQAARREVALGLENASEVEVRSGLKADEQVVVKGQADLPDGAHVTIEAP